MEKPSQDRREDVDVDDVDPDEEARAAAREAGGIGGPDPEPGVDPAERPVAEGGGGEAEGFEEAEDELARGATHDESGASPELDRGEPEPESERAASEYGDPDEAASTEEAEPYER